MHSNSASSSTHKPHHDTLITWLWTGALFMLALLPVEDFDTFWQLQSGKFIWQTKTFLYRDTFSLAKDAFRLEHCWLSDLLFYACYSLGGFILLGLLKTAVITVCGVLLYRRAEAVGVSPLVAVPALSICMVASSPAWVERPQLWTFLLSIIFLKLLFAGRENGLKSWGWLVPLMLVWANLHAGAVFGLVLIGLFWSGELIRTVRGGGGWKPLMLLFCIGLAALGAAFVNPYGARIPMQLLAHANLTKIGGGQEYIAEWLPPTGSQVPLFYIITAVWGVLILVRIKRIDPAEFIYYCAFGYMGWNQIRHSAFVPLLAGFFVPFALHDSLPRSRRCYVEDIGHVCVRYVLALFLVALVIYSLYHRPPAFGLKPSVFPDQAASFIKTKVFPANLYNFYDWGGYLMWRLYPDYLVFVDGRNTSIELLHASNRIDAGSPGWQAELARRGVNTIITRTCYDDTGGPVQLVEALSNELDWALVYADDMSLVYLRREERFRHLWQPLERHPSEAWRTMYAEATRLYRDDKGRSRVMLSLARSAAKLGLYDEARRSYSEFLKHEPGDREATDMLLVLGGGGKR